MFKVILSIKKCIFDLKLTCMQNRVVVETIETQAHRIIIKGDGVVRVYSKPSHIELDDIEALFSAYSRIQMDDERLVVLLDPTEENSMTSEARKHVVKHLKDHVQSIAIVGRKKFIRTLFSIISSVVNIGVNMKMFDSEEKAENWLIQECLKQ